MPPGPSPGHINMETHFGARDGHCQTMGLPWPECRAGDTPGRCGGAGTHGRWGKPCIPPALPCCRFPGQRNGEQLPKDALQPSQVVLPAQRKGNRDGGAWREAPTGRMDRQTDTHPSTVIIKQRMGAREILRWPERAFHPSGSPVELRQEPWRPRAAGLIQQVFIALQICFFFLSSEGLRNGQMQPKGRINPFPRDTGALPAAVFPPSTRGKDPFSPTALKKTQQEVNPRDPETQQLKAFQQGLRSCPQESCHVPAILKAPPKLP